MWRQPKPVWAVAFACVIAFMGIGLVDPILKSIGDELGASPSQVSLLFTSYMVVMGLAMLVTGAVSSRLGAKRTLLIGLTIIIIGAGLAGTLRHGRRHHRVPGGLGAGQRPVHRHRPRHHRQRGEGVGRPGDRAVRGRAGSRHRRRAAHRRRPGLDLLARPVLRGLGPHARRPRRHRAGAAEHPTGGTAHLAGRAVPRAAPPQPARGRAHGAAVQLRLLHPAGLHALPARPRAGPDRPDLLRLGRAAGLHLRGRRAAPAAPLRDAALGGRGARRLLRHARGDGRRHRQQGRCWPPAWSSPARSWASTTPSSPRR